MLELQKAPWNHKDLNKPKDAQNYTKSIYIKFYFSQNVVWVH